MNRNLKASAYAVFAVVVFVLSCLQACKEKVVYPILTPLDLSWHQKELSSEKQTITIQVTCPDSRKEGQVRPYECYIVPCVKITYPDGSIDYEPSDDENAEIPTWAKIINPDNLSDSNDGFTIEVSENDTGSARYLGICIETEYDKYDGGRAWTHAYIEQLPKLDSDNNNAPETMSIRYRGEIHSAIYTIDANGGYQFEDKDFESLLGRLANDQNVEMIILDDEIVDFVDKEDEHFLDFTKTGPKIDNNMQAIETRSSIPGFQYMNDGDLGYFAIYDKANFDGDHKYTVVSGFHNSFTLPNLANYGLNEKISSLAVAYGGDDPGVCAVLTIWEDPDFNHGDNNRSKHRISIVASYYNRTVSRTNLKNVALLRASGNWNDRMSCISCHFGYYDRTLLDY